MTNLLKNKLTNEKIDKLIDEIWCAGYNIGANNGDDDNTEFIKDMKSEFLALIHQAEIKELQRHIIWDGDNVGGIFMTRQEVDERISALEKEIVNE